MKPSVPTRPCPWSILQSHITVAGALGDWKSEGVRGQGPPEELMGMRGAATTSRSCSEPVSAISAFCICEHPGKTAAQPGHGCSLLPLPATLSLSASGATLCPSKCSAVGLKHGYFRFKSTVTANIHLISLLLTSWSQPSKPGWGETHI